MTEISFHFNAPDKLDYGCRLLRKAYGRGARVMVAGDAALLARLDQALWTFEQLEFVPHCSATASPRLLAITPVVLAPSMGGAPHHDVMVNLGDEVMAGFERFEKLIEVVTADEEDRQRARLRWKHYAERGYAIVRHDISQRP